MSKIRREVVMASFELFAQHGPGHLGNPGPAAKEQKDKKKRGGEDAGKQGRTAKQRVDVGAGA